MSLIQRSGASALIPEDVSNEIIQGMTTQSIVLQRFRRATMSAKQQRMPVLSAFPLAYWVDGDSGMKTTTNMAWDNKYLNAEEIACIVPIPQAVLDDSAFDIWGEVRPRVEEALALTLDSAVFFGTNAPSSFPTNIKAAAYAAGNYEEIGTTAAGAGGVAEDINIVMGKVEADGFDVNGFVTSRAFRTTLRAARDSTGQQLFDVALNTLYGEPVTYGIRGQWPSDAYHAKLFAGDWSQFVAAVRQDITYKFLDQAVIQDPNTGTIVYNLAQQDMVAMRVTFRVAWQVANQLTREQPTEGSRYPVGYLRASS